MHNKELEVVKWQEIEKISSNELELEKIKISAETAKEKINRFEKRCNEISILLDNVSSNYYTIYDDSSSDNIQPTLDNFSAIKILQQKADTYFGDEAKKEFVIVAEEVKKMKDNNPTHRALPYIAALKKELGFCNRVDSFAGQ